MCKVINYNLCKRGGLSESTSVSNAQNFSSKIKYGNEGTVCIGWIVPFFVYNFKMLFAE
mgnify:CR=1 FL=1